MFAIICALLALATLNPTNAQEPDELLKFTPTGDALFDRYARACLEQDWTGYQFDDFDAFPATIEPAVIAEWEEEFGEDPRYWQLCYFNLKHRYYGDPESEELLKEYEGAEWDIELEAGEFTEYLMDIDEYYTYLGRKLRDPAQALRSADELGVANAETLLLLHRELLREWKEQSARYDLYDAEGEEQPVPELSQIELNRQYEQRELALLKRAVDLGPDQAWPHYMLADYYLEYGEPELAQPELASGNSAGDNRLPACFPLSFVLDCIDDGLLPGNAMLTGAILEAGSSDEVCYPAWRTGSFWVDRIAEQRVRINLGGGPDLTQDMFIATCRRALAVRSTPHVGTRLAGGISSLASHAEEMAISPEPGQIDALQIQLPFGTKLLERESGRALLVQQAAPGLVGAYLALLEHADDLSRMPYGPMMLGGHDLGYFETPELPLTESRLRDESLYLNVPMYRFARLYEVWSEETTEFRADCDWIFEHLQEYDYTTLEYPESWPSWNWLNSRPFAW
jgi:hypothetical protein